MNDIGQFVNSLLEEGRGLFETSSAACLVQFNTSRAKECYGSEAICAYLADLSSGESGNDPLQPVQLIRLPENGSSMTGELRSDNDQTEHTLVIYRINQTQQQSCSFALLTHLDPIPEDIIEQGMFLAQILRLALQNSLLAESTLGQAAELGVFYETSASLTFDLDNPGILESTMKKSLRLLDGQYGIIFNNDGEEIVDCHASTVTMSPELEFVYQERARTAFDQSQESGIPFSFEFLPNRPDQMINQDSCHDGPKPGFNALIGHVLWEKKELGVLVVLSEENQSSSAKNRLSLFKLLTFQIANILGVTQLIEAEREQRRYTEALQSASVMIGRQIHLDEVLDTILEQARYAFHCVAANVMILEGPRARIERALGYEALGMDKEVVEDFSLQVSAHNNLVRMSDGEAIYVADTSSQDDWVVHEGYNWCHSWAGAPIIYNSTLLGFINLDSTERNTFTEQTLDQLLAFATHAAIAIHKAKLYERLTNEHLRLKQVYDVGRKISGSLDPDLILQQLLSASLEVLGGVYGVVFSIDEDSSSLNLILKNNPLKLGSLHELYLVELLAKKIALIQEPDCDYIAYPDHSYWLLGLPLRSGGSILGIVLVWVPSASEFEQAWLDALANLGQQAALALTKAEKHLELQRHLDELTILQHVSSAIARQLDVDAILKELTEQLQEKLGYTTTQVFFRKDDYLHLRQYSGPPLQITSLHMDEGVVGKAARTGLPILVHDVSTETQYIEGIEGTVSELAVPILQDRQVIGVINVETSNPKLLDEGTRELLLLLADQVSIALRNAELYTQIRETVGNLESRVQARTAVLEAVAVQAQEAERVKAQFVADVSHELRTPLTNIGLYLDLLEFAPEERYQDYFHTLRRETDRLKGLIEQLLAISRLDSEQVELQLQEVRINDLLLSLVEDRQMMAERKGLDLILEIEDNLPAVYADPQYLVQVMTNLLTNAMNYTPDGGKIFIRSYNHSMMHQKGISFAFEDTGPGIPHDEQAEIFNRFFRGTTGRNSGVSGTGLGLSISREIMKQHHGTIILTSEPGKGTLFTVWLPLMK